MGTIGMRIIESGKHGHVEKKSTRATKLGEYRDLYRGKLVMQSKDTGDHRNASLRSLFGDLLGLGNKDPGEHWCEPHQPKKLIATRRGVW